MYEELPLPTLIHILELQSRAEELGFKWNKEKYFTPAWKVGEYPFLNKARFGINQDVWNREIKGWAADCVEHVLPAWETWAQLNNPLYQNNVRNNINKARDYINGICTEEEIKACVEKNGALSKYGIPQMCYRILRASACIHTFPLVAASNTYTINSPNNRLPEVEWQRIALANRIDNIAPWGRRVE